MDFVASLTTETTTVANPSWADVERAISALDAKGETLVILAPASGERDRPADCHMAVGGGLGGRFVVYMTEDNLHFWNLIDPVRQGDQRSLRVLIGGQEGEYREEQFVSLDQALRAARHYMEGGGRDPELVWSHG
jgi:immunity protein Imm1 of predicted polymorphic toxin system